MEKKLKLLHMHVTVGSPAAFWLIMPGPEEQPEHFHCPAVKQNWCITAPRPCRLGQVQVVRQSHKVARIS